MILSSVAIVMKCLIGTENWILERRSFEANNVRVLEWPLDIPLEQ